MEDYSMHISFGAHLRSERKKHKLTVQQIAEACKVSRSYITLIENDKRLPGKKILPKIATALHLKTAVVLNWYLGEMREKFKKIG